MKKLVTAVLIICLGITSVNAQWWSSEKQIKGNGNYITKTRKTNSYDQVNLVGFMDVILIKGTEGNLEIKAESNLQEYITTEVRGSRLKISVEKGVNLKPSHNKMIIIKVPFEDIEATSVTGSGDIVLDIEANKIKSNVTGSGDIVLKGKTSHLDCEVTGSGDLDAYKLKAKTVAAQVSGSGDVMVYAEEELQAKVSGSGDITYKGNPRNENFKTFGSGDISKY